MNSCRYSSGSSFESAFLPVTNRLLRRIVPGRSGHASAGMNSRSAEIKPCNRRAVLRPPRNRTHKEELLQAKVAVEDIAFGQPIGAFEIERRQHLPRDDR